MSNMYPFFKNVPEEKYWGTSQSNQKDINQSKNCKEIYILILDPADRDWIMARHVW